MQPIDLKSSHTEYVDNANTYFAAIQYIISWTDGDVQSINGIWSLQMANGAASQCCVIHCHACIDRDVA